MVSIRPLKSCRWIWMVRTYRFSMSPSGPPSSLSVCRSRTSWFSLCLAMARSVRSMTSAAVLDRQQLVDGDVVELGEPLQPRHRDRSLAPLVGAEHGGLELRVGVRLDLVQAEPLLTTDGPEALTDLAAVRPDPPRPVPRHRCRHAFNVSLLFPDRRPSAPRPRSTALGAPEPPPESAIGGFSGCLGRRRAFDHQFTTERTDHSTGGDCRRLGPEHVRPRPTASGSRSRSSR